MPMFSPAQSNVINNSTLVNLERGNYIHQSLLPSDGLEKLEHFIAAGAMHNSGERSEAPRCHPETRLAVQKDIMSWVTHGEKEKKMMWVTGPAGTGKTAIAQTIAELCHQQGILAASFFFSSITVEKAPLVATLAYQLSQAIEELREPIAAAVQKDHSIFKKNLETQMEILVLRPILAAVGDGVRSWPNVIVIDGLDECVSLRKHDPMQPNRMQPNDPWRKEKDQREILKILSAVALGGHFPFRVLIASRPERAIRKFFKEDAEHCTNVITLDDKYDPAADISLLLRCSFAEIRRKYLIEGTAGTWPTEEVIQTLVDTASGQFIYATTVLRFVDDPTQSPQHQLQKVLDLETDDSQESNPFGPIDALYSAILHSSPDPIVSIKWLWIIKELQDQLCHENPFPATFVNQLLQLYPGDAERLLGNLHSLLAVPEANDSLTPYSFYHKSLFDFLQAPSRSADLCIVYWDWYTYYLLRYLEMYRDPGVAANPEKESFLKHCSGIMCAVYPYDDIDHSGKPLLHYDVNWWIRHQIQCNHGIPAGFAYIVIHRTCKWYHCRKICRHWRGAILRGYQKAGWVVPSPFRRFRDRFRDNPHFRGMFYPRPGPENLDSRDEDSSRGDPEAPTVEVSDVI